MECIDARYNALSAGLEATEHEELRDRHRLYAIDSVMREVISLQVELLSASLEALEELQTRPLHTRTFLVFSDILQPLVNEIQEGNLNDFGTLMSAREFVVEGGQYVHIDETKREELKVAFADTLKKTILVFQEKVLGFSSENLDEIVDCQINAAKWNEEKTRLTEIYYQMLDNKTALTDELERLAAQQRWILAIRTSLARPSKNQWNAAQGGDLSYLQAAYRQKWFWQRKAFLNELKDGRSLLHFSCSGRHSHVTRWLLDFGANPRLRDSDGYMPLHWAAKVGDLDSVQALAGVDVNGRGLYGRTPLHMGAHNGHHLVVRCLLDNGADINAQTNKEDAEKTPLHDAVLRNRSLVVSALVRHPLLDPNLRDSSGHSPFYHAVCDGLVDIATLIVGHVKWKPITDPTDPDYSVFRKTPRDNADAMREFLEKLTGTPRS
jgi:ankyrin repeat protein